MARMQRAMDIEYSCDPGIDFVRGMIPHHQGAVEMCNVLDGAQLWSEVGMVHFCNHVYLAQTWEVQGMRRWLQEHHACRSNGCNTSCQEARAYQAANEKMHEAMAINYTCKVEQDFVQAMMPHHQGAVDMCAILLTSTEDEYLLGLCRNITRLQRAELAWMQDWLTYKAVPIGASCSPSVVRADDYCADLMPITDVCHDRAAVRGPRVTAFAPASAPKSKRQDLGGDRICDCSGLLDSCSTTISARGRRFAVSMVCQESCGLCEEQKSATDIVVDLLRLVPITQAPTSAPSTTESSAESTISTRRPSVAVASSAGTWVRFSWLSAWPWLALVLGPRKTTPTRRHRSVVMLLSNLACCRGPHADMAEKQPKLETVIRTKSMEADVKVGCRMPCRSCKSGENNSDGGGRARKHRGYLRRLTQPYFLSTEASGWRFAWLVCSMLCIVLGLTLCDSGFMGLMFSMWKSPGGGAIYGLSAFGTVSFIMHRQYLKGRRWIGWILLGAIVFVLLIINILNTGIGFIARDLTNALVKRDTGRRGDSWVKATPRLESSSAGRKLTLALLAYSGTATLVLILSSHKLVRINYNQLRYEADFRYGLVHNDTSVRALRPCCLSDVEAIAFYAGEEPEKKETKRRLGWVVTNFNYLIKWEVIISVLRRSYGYAGNFFPYLIMAPAYLAVRSPQSQFKSFMEEVPKIHLTFRRYFLWVAP
eukprot:g922.t1